MVIVILTMTDISNPYTPPTAPLAPDNDESQRFEAIRREHINHEASIRSVGLLYYLSAIFLFLIAVGTLFSGIANTDSIASIFTVVYLVLAILFAPLAHGLRKLRGWVKVPVTILSALGLIGFPVGTIINGYIIYLVWCKKGEMVFSPQYREIAEQTPHIKYRTSIVVWFILILILIGILAAIIPAFISS